MRNATLALAASLLALAGCYEPLDGEWCHPLQPGCDFDGDGTPNATDPCPTDSDATHECGEGCAQCPGAFPVGCVSGLCVDIDLDAVSIPGGSFSMGSGTGESDELPVHTVTVPGFLMLRTEVTVAQYRTCVDAGGCTEPGAGGDCNWNVAGRDDHPVNCVEWDQARQFCEWAGGRLPSEAEWEYAARSGGQPIEYPWGDESPTCERAVMDTGCGEFRTWPVCSKPAGNSDQGLCDLSGNVWEWVQDWYHDGYTGAPADGSAWESPVGPYRVVRGGSWNGNFVGTVPLRATDRGGCDAADGGASDGFRCVGAE